MGQFIAPSDLAPFATIDPAKAEAMIEDAEATTLVLAPCLAELPADDPKRGAVKALLRGALLRWNEAGTGALSSHQETVGPFGQTLSMDTRQTRKGMFWPSEIEHLQGMCAETRKGAFEVDTVGPNVGPGYWSAPDAWTPIAPEVP